AVLPNLMETPSPAQASAVPVFTWSYLLLNVMHKASQAEQHDISALTQQVAQLTTIMLSQHGHSATTCSVSPCLDPPIPEPDVFDGNVDKCRGFLLQCRRVFKHQPRTYCTDREKINYVKPNQLRGKARTWAEAADTSGSLIGTTITEFLNKIRSVFSPSSHQSQASRKLMTIRQGARQVLDYSIDFRVLAMEAGGEDCALGTSTSTPPVHQSASSPDNPPPPCHLPLHSRLICPPFLQTTMIFNRCLTNT
uniref:DUF4939 domain-containing protein n=1 Tax=Monopterus albus TaxID=43700 RepID=A0A3Q3K0N4_MONAL